MVTDVAVENLASPVPYSRGYLRYALGLLTVFYAFNFIDRQILVILQESNKMGMALSDADPGRLAAFVISTMPGGQSTSWGTR